MRRVNIERTKHPDIIQLTQKKSRYYYNQEKDKYYPSVTHIVDDYPKGQGMKQWLLSKTKLEAKQEQNEAKDRGSKIHHAIYDLLNGREVKFDDEYWAERKDKVEPLTEKEWDAIVAFRDWFKESDLEVLESEMVTYSDKHNYAGTVDCIAKLDGKVTVLDWKTGSGIYKSNWLQVAAYMRSLRDNSKWNPKQTAILRLGTRHKNGYEPLKVKGWQESQKNFTLFKKIKAIWKDSQSKVEPDIKEVPESIKLSL